MTTRFKTLLGVIAIIWVAFALRSYQIGAVALRGDEAFSAQYWAGIPPQVSLNTIATIEPHPPLTYIIFWAWGSLVGIHNETALRLLPALFNLIAIPTLFILGKRLHSPKVGFLVAFLWAIHPFEIWHSQDFRNYAIWASLSIQTLYWGHRVITRRESFVWFVYFIVATTSAMVFYFEMFTISALAIYGVLALTFLTQHKEKSKPKEQLFSSFLRNWLIVHALIAFIVMGVFWAYQSRLFVGGSYGGNTSTFSLDGSFYVLGALLFGETLHFQWLQVIGAFSAIVILVLSGRWAFFSRDKRDIGLLTLAIVLIAFAEMSFISRYVSIFSARYILCIIPLLLLTLAIFFYSVSSKWLRVVAIVVYLGLTGVSLFNHYFVPSYQKSPDWYRVRDYIRANLTDDDYVIQTAVDAAFGYYFGDEQRNKGLPYSPKQSSQYITMILQDISARYDSIWLFSHTRLNSDNATVVPDWLNTHWQLVRETQLIGKPFQQYIPFAVSPQEIDHALNITWQDGIQLAGYRLFTPEPDGYLTVWLYWQPLALSPQAYSVSVQLIGATNPATNTPLWSQDDQLPQNGRVQTDTWQIGTLYRDSFRLPLDGVTNGEYTLIVKWYDAQSGQSLLRDDGTEFATITTVTLNR
jgi:hypothetical protein